MIITLSLVYNIQCFSGMIFQFVAEPVHRKKKSAMDVLAAGGRYDKLVSPLIICAYKTCLKYDSKHCEKRRKT